MEPHPDFPTPVDHVEPCPRCHQIPDFSDMPGGDYRYVRLADHSVVCQLAVPSDPKIAPYLGRPVIAHACGPVMDRATEAQARAASPLVIAGAEQIVRQAEQNRHGQG